MGAYNRNKNYPAKLVPCSRAVTASRICGCLWVGKDWKCNTRDVRKVVVDMPNINMIAFQGYKYKKSGLGLDGRLNLLNTYVSFD